VPFRYGGSCGGSPAPSKCPTSDLTPLVDPHNSPPTLTMPYRSPFPPFELPPYDFPHAFFEKREIPFPRDHIITSDSVTGESLSFESVRQLARSFGRGLKKHLGFQKGDVICLYSTNHVLSYRIWAHGRYIGTRWFSGHGTEAQSWLQQIQLTTKPNYFINWSCQRPRRLLRRRVP